MYLCNNLFKKYKCDYRCVGWVAWFYFDFYNIRQVKREMTINSCEEKNSGQLGEQE